MTGISVRAFFDELEKVAVSQIRDSSSPWAPQTVEAPRIKAPDAAAAKAPEMPGTLAPKIVRPAGRIGTRLQSGPNPPISAATDPELGEPLRQAAMPIVQTS